MSHRERMETVAASLRHIRQEVVAWPFLMQRAESRITVEEMRLSAETIEARAEQRRWIADEMEARGLKRLTPGECLALLRERGDAP